MDLDASDTAAQSRLRAWLVLALAVLILLALLAVLFSSGVNTTTQTGPAGQCQFASRQFYTQQEAFTLAQATQDHRSSSPFGGNYALGSYTICYKNNTQQRFQSPFAQGYDNLTGTTRPINATHAEQAIYNWLQNQLAQLTIDQSTVQGIYVVVFSQVRVCTACRSVMASWQRTLRQKAGTEKLSLSIWDLKPGFDPATYPAGPANSVEFGNLERVPIVFSS